MFHGSAPNHETLPLSLLVILFLNYSLLRKRPAVAQAQSGAVVLNARLPWPAVLDLPTTFRPDVVQALQEKDGSKVTKKIRKNFITRIYEHFSRFTL